MKKFDPDACLASAEEALRDNRLDECLALLREYKAWAATRGVVDAVTVQWGAEIEKSLGMAA